MSRARIVELRQRIEALTKSFGPDNEAMLRRVEQIAAAHNVVVDGLMGAVRFAREHKDLPEIAKLVEDARVLAGPRDAELNQLRQELAQTAAAAQVELGDRALDLFAAIIPEGGSRIVALELLDLARDCFVQFLPRGARLEIEECALPHKSGSDEILFLKTYVNDPDIDVEIIQARSNVELNHRFAAPETKARGEANGLAVRCAWPAHQLRRVVAAHHNTSTPKIL